MCVSCLRTQVDITDGIPRSLVIHQCRNCGRWNRPPWVKADLESRELLAVCLKKISGLHRVKLVDANFIWTEPHSRRIKLRLTIEKDTDYKVRLRQAVVVEFKVQNEQCTDCEASFTEHTWKACVQVRQKVDHKKTFLFLEQVILKNNAQEKCSNIESKPTGVDFFFRDRSDAAKFVSFVGSVVPTRFKSAKQLISQDVQNNLYRYKHTFSVEIVPLCKGDLVVLPPRTAAALGSISPLTLVERVHKTIRLVDPLTLQMAELTSDKYFSEPFRPLQSVGQLTEFLVLDVVPAAVEVKGAPAGTPDPATMASAANGRRHGRKRRSRRTNRRNRKKKGNDSDSDDEDMDNDDDATSLITSAPGGSRSVGAGQGGMGGVTMGRRIYTSASSVTTSVTGGPRGSFLLCDVEIARLRDIEDDSARFTVRSHLGNILKAGDSVMGYDLTSAVLNEADFNDDLVAQQVAEDSRGGPASAASVGKGRNRRGQPTGPMRRLKGPLPDVVLVRKVYPRKKNKKRRWKLKKLPMDSSGTEKKESAEQAAAEYEAFLQEVEEDRHMRSAMRLYRTDEKKTKTGSSGGEEEEAAAGAGTHPPGGESEEKGAIPPPDGGAAGSAEGDEDFVLPEELEDGDDGDAGAPPSSAQAASAGHDGEDGEGDDEEGHDEDADDGGEGEWQSGHMAPFAELEPVDETNEEA